MLLNLLLRIVIGALIIFLILFGGCIFLILNSSKLKANPEVNSIDLGNMQDEHASFYDEYNQFLVGEGFEHMGDYSVSSMPNKSVYMRLFRNFREGIDVSLYKVQSESAKKLMISFETEFEDGLNIITTTSREPSVFKHKKRVVSRLSDIKWSEILKHHREMILEEQKRNNINWAKMSKPADENMIVSFQQELIEQTEYGILKYAPDTDMYCFTLYGAILGTYKMLEFNLTKGRKIKNSKTIFDTRFRRENKKKQWIKSLNTFGFVTMIMGLMFLFRKASNNQVLIFRMLLIVFGALIVIITRILLRRLKLEDSWK